MLIVTWLLSLPLLWKIVIPLLVLVSTVIIALWGGLTIQWGKKTIRLGTNRKGRSCMDCSRYVRITQTKVDRKICTIENKKLKDKMNYSEQRLLGLQSLIVQMYSQLVHSKGVSPGDLSGLPLDVKESQECNLFEARLGQLIHLIKDELRRSFKENGFHELSEIELSVYIQDQIKTILAMTDNYLGANYPRQMIISLDEVKDVLHSLRHDVRDAIEDTYRRAKEVEIESEHKITMLETEYETDITTFINAKQG